MKKLVLAIASMSGLLHAIGAFAAPCTDIVSLPTTISIPGRYCLTGDLLFTGTAPISQMQRAVNVISNDVTVDLNGFSIIGAGSAPQSNLSFAVYSSGRSNVTVTNGRIRGFGVGVGLYPVAGTTSKGHVVEDLSIDSTLLYGIAVFAESLTVRNNQVTNVANLNSQGTSFGISASGAGARVLDNQVSNVTSGISSAGGIYAAGFGVLIQGNIVSGIGSPIRTWGIVLGSGASNSTVKNNVIHNSATSGDGISATVVAANLMIDNNVITGFTYAINLGANRGKYRNNTSLGAASGAPYLGGVNIGGNN